MDPASNTSYRFKEDSKIQKMTKMIVEWRAAVMVFVTLGGITSEKELILLWGVKPSEKTRLLAYHETH